MACKFNEHHKDCLYWIYPLVILALIVVTMVQDEHKKEYDASTGADFNAGVPPAIKKNLRIADSLRIKESSDSINIYFATK